MATIEIKILINLHKLGFKLIPLGEDGKTHNIAGLLTPEEKQKSPASSRVLEGRET
jgi:hypothetical protein